LYANCTAFATDVANVASEREASRSLQDTMEVDGEDVEIDGPTVKLKLSAPEEVVLGDLLLILVLITIYNRAYRSYVVSKPRKFTAITTVTASPGAESRYALG
jgi:hypothetical protein